MLQCGGKLQKSLEGPAYDVFIKALRGLSACKLTRPSKFRTADEVGFAVRCSYKVCSLQSSQQPACTVALYPVGNTIKCLSTVKNARFCSQICKVKSAAR
jgi:hypothetical protein